MQKRFVLWWMLFFLVACNLLVTLNMDIAIVSMVNFQHKSSENSNRTKNNTVCPNTTFFLKPFLSGDKGQRTSAYHQKVTYNWSKKEQGVVLSGYYWLNYFSILPAGILAQKYGPKRVMGLAQGSSLIISFLIPILADYGYLIVACTRAIQGFLSYMCVPVGIYNIIGRWSPPQERGNFASVMVVGASFGYAVANFCFGYIAEYFAWQYIFYLTSICGIIWFICWYIFVFDEPLKHPSITIEEREYIENSLQKSTHSKVYRSILMCIYIIMYVMQKYRMKEPIPWKRIITCIPVIVCIFAVNSSSWYFVMLATYMPIYLKSVYGLSVKEIGIITSFPPILTCIVVLVVGYTGDLLIKKGVLTLERTRKIWTFIGCLVASIPLILMAFTTCNVNVIIICILLSFMLRACSMFGPCLGLIDLSPKFCGILDGISGTVGSIQTFLYAFLITQLRGILSTEDFWKFVFIFTASLVILTNSLYLIFGSWRVQQWNFSSFKENEEVK